jgi:hypothetical protein
MTVEQAYATIERACADPNSNVTATRGGTVTYWGTEVGSQVALYSAVARVLTAFLGPRQLGLRNVETRQPRSGRGAGEGVWVRPDLVVFADPRRRPSVNDPRRTHAIEIEQRSGFDVRSIYQAYEQGRGANYTWVFANSEVRNERVARAALELGVGTVTFTNPSVYGTYVMSQHSEYRPVQRRDREGFLARCRIPDLG